jgi:hypothetical protein
LDDDNDNPSKRIRSSSFLQDIVSSHRLLSSKFNPINQFCCSKTGKHIGENNWELKIRECSECKLKLSDITRPKCDGKKHYYYFNKVMELYKCEDCGFTPQYDYDKLADPYSKLPCSITGNHTGVKNWDLKIVECSECKIQLSELTRERCSGKEDSKNHFAVADMKSGDVICEDCFMILKSNILVQDSLNSEGTRYSML